MSGWTYDPVYRGVFNDRRIMVADLDPCFGILSDDQITRLGQWIAEDGPAVIADLTIRPEASQ